MLKKILFCFLCVTILILISCTKKEEKKENYPPVTGEFSLTSLKTENSECFLLKTQNFNILINCAKYENAKEIIEFLNSEGIKEIDYLIITQFTDNNIGSAGTILRKKNIKNIYQPSYIPKSTDIYKKYISTLKYKEITPHTVNKDEKLTTDDIHFEFYECENNKYSNDENNCSLVFKVTHGENSFLFSGNIKNERIKDLIDSKKNINAKFIKMPFYGRFFDASYDFIKHVNPEFAFIPCSENNPSSNETEKILSKKNVKTFYSYNDAFTFISDGKTLTERKY